MENKLRWNEVENTLYIEGHLYKSVWFKHFGDRQNKILELKNDNIIIDMRECMFVSPTPFLSLLLTLKKAKVVNNCKVTIILPLEDTDRRKKFLNYCAKEGFLEIINDISEKKYNTQSYRHFNLIGTNDFEKILNARICEVDKDDDIQQIVSELISEINESNLSVSKHQKLYMLIAIRNILQELIDNVNKHAYEEDSSNKFYAVYIRMRNVTDRTIRRGSANNSFKGLRVRTKPEEVYVQKAIEVYFQDIGIGIIASHEKKKIKFDNRPLHEIVKYTFFRNEFENRLNNTPITGLAFLRKILKEKNNFFSVYNQYEGTGAFGRKDKELPVNSVHLKDFKGEVHAKIEGQIYNFTLFDRNDINDEPVENLEDLLELYKREYTPKRMFVVDLRKENEIIEKIHKLKTLYLFMPEYLTKNTILKILKEVCIKNSELNQIIISDIEDQELALFNLTLDGLFKESLTEKYGEQLNLKRIYVITKSLKIRCFSQEGQKFKNLNVTFREFNKEFDYLYDIKAYESQELASVLENNEIGKYIVTTGNIEWSNGKVISGFINFDMLASNDICFDLLHRSLERIMSVIGDKRLYAIDSTVERLVNSINCFYENENKEQFGIGSVYVSGMTLQSSNFKGNNMHFFCRGSKKVPAVFFDPVYLYKRKSTENKEPIYTRIGKSSRIRKKDNKVQKRNLNSYLNEKETYKILHQYAYSSVLCGHLAFENRHDLLSINLDAIMYDQGTKLKEYVEGIVKYSLGHYFKEDFNEDLKNNEKKYRYFSNLSDVCMIVYPYNQLTSSIFKKCDIDEKYRKYMISLSPTNITKSGEDLEYSQCFQEYIEEIIKEYNMKNPENKIKVIIFDTLSYSGRTKQDIFEFINSIKEVDAYFVNIIDAKVNHYQKPKNFYNYININIPLLGESETCKMCLVLNKLEIFKDSVIDAAILSTIGKIQETWKVQDIRNCTELIKLSNFDRIYAENILLYDSLLECKEDGLYFVNALPLYIYITNRIKLENDFYPMEFVIDNYRKHLDDDSMAYILSLFLLEYGDSIYHSLLQKACNFLLVYMKENKKLEVRQLAVLSILSLNEEKIETIVITYLKENIQGVQSTLEGQIILLYFLNKIKQQELNPKITFLYNKMKSGNIRLDLYKQFHCQLKNTNGNVHNTPLMCLINGQETPENKRLVLACLSLLEQSLNRTELSFDILYEEGRYNENNKIDIDISTIRDECLLNINKMKKAIQNRNNSKIIKEGIRDIFNAGQLLHMKLFAPYKNKELKENSDIKPIEVLLGERIDIYNENRGKNKFEILYKPYSRVPLEISDNIAAIYYIWNNMLVREIDYILDNVGKFVNKERSVLIGNKRIAGEVDVEITSTHFTIKIFNNTEELIEDIKEKSKQRYQKEVLELLGIEFLYTNNMGQNESFDNNAVVTQIKIPNIQNRRG